MLSKSGLGLKALVNALKINHEERQQLILDILIVTYILLIDTH
jgi:hypothetical protein